MKTVIKIVVSAMLTGLLSACITAPTLEEFAKLPGTPGYISESTSKFDGAQEISMEPGWTRGDIRLGLFWRSTMDPDVIYITALVHGAHNLKSLSFNIDGEFVSFKPSDTSTNIWTEPGSKYFPPINKSQRKYKINRQLIKRLVNAERVVVRLDLMRNYVEGVFSNDLPTMARPAFRTFYAMVWGDTLNTETDYLRRGGDAAVLDFKNRQTRGE